MKRGPISTLLAALSGLLLAALFSNPICWAQPPAPAPVEVPGPDIEVREIDRGVFVVTHSFPWEANSLLVMVGENEALFVDTPYTPEATSCILDRLEERHGAKVILEINTGFHIDNLGGNQALMDRGIPVYGSDRTVQLLRERGEESRALMLSLLQGPRNTRYREGHARTPYVPPDHLFPLEEGSVFTIGGERVEVIFPGETHSPDNTVVYFPRRKILFGGCMVLAGEGPGNTADANMKTWKTAINGLRSLECRYVVPGHGLRFDPGLIENTIAVLP